MACEKQANTPLVGLEMTARATATAHVTAATVLFSTKFLCVKVGSKVATRKSTTSPWIVSFRCTSELHTSHRAGLLLQRGRLLGSSRLQSYSCQHQHDTGTDERAVRGSKQRGEHWLSFVGAPREPRHE